MAQTKILWRYQTKVDSYIACTLYYVIEVADCFIVAFFILVSVPFEVLAKEGP